MSPRFIGRDELRRLLDEGGAQLVEVLPKEEYEEERLPGAIHLPLKSLTPERVEELGLDRSKPVIAYCWDGL